MCANTQGIWYPKSVDESEADVPESDSNTKTSGSHHSKGQKSRKVFFGTRGRGLIVVSFLSAMV